MHGTIVDFKGLIYIGDWRKKKVSKLEQDSSTNPSKDVVKFPSGAEKLRLERCNIEEGLVKATLSCEDRPELMQLISKAVGSANTKLVKAEIVSVGGEPTFLHPLSRQV